MREDGRVRAGASEFPLDVGVDAREDGRSRSESDGYSPFASSTRAVRRGTGKGAVVDGLPEREVVVVGGGGLEGGAPFVNSSTVKGGSSSGMGFGNCEGTALGVGRGPPEDDRLEYRFGIASSGTGPGVSEPVVTLRELFDSDSACVPLVERRVSRSRPPLGLDRAGMAAVDEDELWRSCRRELEATDSPRERRSALTAAASR